MEIDAALKALSALSQETRLLVFRMLVQAGPEGLSVGRIAERLGTQANGRLSFHLKELAHAGLVTATQSGRFIFYSANYPVMNDLLAYLTEHCCAGQSCGGQDRSCHPAGPAGEGEPRV
ncbi:helix-turn-helix transcriptional regulator [Azovibrio restrictus]|uniref:ArsR/SmtB family transcription factor n=1 Tax=Azovibrio restrictus TaxID=146938 RepID=UPI0026EAD574|nr:metalloregulator ArsR/SmtB family transcription factor [Azovibrio restrictus]